MDPMDYKDEQFPVKKPKRKRIRHVDELKPLRNVKQRDVSKRVLIDPVYNKDNFTDPGIFNNENSN